MKEFVLIVHLILGGQDFQQRAVFFDTLEECQFFIPKDQTKRQNLQITGACYSTKTGNKYETN